MRPADLNRRRFLEGLAVALILVVCTVGAYAQLSLPHY